MPQGKDQTTIRKVVLSEREQRALLWLLSATDNGQIVSGFQLPNVMVLSGIKKRLGRSGMSESKTTAEPTIEERLALLSGAEDDMAKLFPLELATA